ncbi:MAG: prolipoprotein diacylglyceryl transferase family protein [Pseudomonadota bacterium]
MTTGIFVGSFAVVYLVILRWACRTLPGERWQIFASIPLRKNGSGDWQGLNITFYGLIVSAGYTTGSAMVLVMMGAAGVPPVEALFLLAPLFSLCVPAASWVARIVERKPQTLTVGGASFVGLLAIPWLALAVREALGGSHNTGPGLQVIPAAAAAAVGYAVGEGLGRLACISFGCCYGKPLDQCRPLLQRVFSGRGFIFTGPTKKISYESGLEGRPVAPIQAVTSVICVGAGLLGFYLFLIGKPTASFLTTLILTQLWRAWSEVFRADYRGGGKISVYQYLALAGVAYGTVVAFAFPLEPGFAPNLNLGLAALWSPWVLIGLEGLWLAVVYHVGRSKVTGAVIRFHVVSSEI